MLFLIDESLSLAIESYKDFITYNNDNGETFCIIENTEMPEDKDALKDFPSGLLTLY